jgi:hypothetical protein
VCTYAAHDSTLTAVNAVLGRIGAWPPYAAHVEFELWRDDSDDAYYVQIVADGSVYRPWGATVDMLPLQWFQDQLRDVVISEQVRVCARVVWWCVDRPQLSDVAKGLWKSVHFSSCSYGRLNTQSVVKTLNLR